MCPPEKDFGLSKTNLINLFIALSSDLQELYCQELVYTILFMTKYIQMTT